MFPISITDSLHEYIRIVWSHMSASGMLQEARRRQKELEQVERQNAAAVVPGTGPQAAPSFPLPAARPQSARSARFAQGIAD